MIYDLQKASMTKRISAYLLDIILMVILITGFALLMSYVTDIDTDIGEYREVLSEYSEKHSENEWGILFDYEKGDYTMDITGRTNEVLTDEQRQYLIDCEKELKADERYPGKDLQETEELYKEYSQRHSSNIHHITIDYYNQTYRIDVRYLKEGILTEEQLSFISSCTEELESDDKFQYACDMMFNKALIIISISFLLAHLILEFIVPLIFKNGQTFGKKVFAIGVMRIDGVKVQPVVLFVRAILGKFTIEAMIPAFLIMMHYFGLGTIVTLGVLILIVLFEIILIIATKTNSLIHDILSSTVVVDLQSQMIFDSVEAKNEYRLRIHSEDAKNAKYF